MYNRYHLVHLVHLPEPGKGIESVKEKLPSSLIIKSVNLLRCHLDPIGQGTAITTVTTL